MQQVRIATLVLDLAAIDAFKLLRDFGAYPRLCKAVRHVRVEKMTEDQLRSSWEVNFQGGILKWQEVDLIDQDQLEIAFNQVAGDIDHFSGRWHVEDAPGGCKICFSAQFDLGMPMLADMLDPVAKNAIEENIRSIITGLFFQEELQATR